MSKLTFKTKILSFLSVLLMLTAVITYKYIYFPYVSHLLGGYNYSYPESGEDFVVYSEPDQQIPNFIRKIIKVAFNDRNVVFTNDKTPHLIVRNRRYTAKSKQLNAPYITYSGEHNIASPHKYFRKNGLPLIEFTSHTPQNKRQLYFPFIIWSGSMSADREVKNAVREKFLAYISSNCVKKREALFNLLNRSRHADALGLCSNESALKNPELGPRNANTPGNWGNLCHIYSQYNFAFAMENTQTPGYLTEKIITVMKAGAIPIYWGDSNTVEKYFNTEAYIDVGKFSSLEEAAEYIIQLSNDQERVRKMQQAPMFKDGVMPELFKIDLDDKLDYPIIQETAQTLRKRYFKLLAKDKQGIQGWNIDVWDDNKNLENVISQY